MGADYDNGRHVMGKANPGILFDGNSRDLFNFPNLYGYRFINFYVPAQKTLAQGVGQSAVHYLLSLCRTSIIRFANEWRKNSWCFPLFFQPRQSFP